MGTNDCRFERELELPVTGIKISVVTSGGWSKSAQEIIGAMTPRERGPSTRAEMFKSRMRTKIPKREESLSGQRKLKAAAFQLGWFIVTD